MKRYLAIQGEEGTTRHVIQDWPIYDILLCKVINPLCNRIGRITKSTWFCRNVHVPIAKWQDKRRYYAIFDSSEFIFQHHKGQKEWNDRRR